MCVTNITTRFRKPVAASSQMMGKTPSMLSHRLMGNFMPMMLNTAIPKTAGTVSTTDSVAPEQALPSTSNFFPSPISALPPQEVEQKKRPKRRRKPQKPGKTAKQNDRHFVVHNYHDHATDPNENDEEKAKSRRRGGVTISFPMKLHAVLDQVEEDGLAHIVSWSPHGRCFIIHKPKEFVDHVMPNYFRQSKLTSFQRQLNLYGFFRLTRGNDSGGYYHELFLRGKIFLAKKMQRTKVKGTKFKAASSPDQEPDFYKMPPVIVTPPGTSDDSSSDERMEFRSPIVRRRVPEANLIFPTEALPTMYESMPVQVPTNSLSSTLEPIPLAAYQPNFVVNNNNWNAMGNVDMSNRTEEGDILDEAVEELFSSDPIEGDAGDLDKLWDTSDFEGGGLQNDIRLGYLLERLLEE